MQPTLDHSLKGGEAKELSAEIWGLALKPAILQSSGFMHRKPDMGPAVRGLGQVRNKQLLSEHQALGCAKEPESECSYEDTPRKCCLGTCWRTGNEFCKTQNKVGEERAAAHVELPGLWCWGELWCSLWIFCIQEPNVCPCTWRTLAKVLVREDIWKV